MNRIRRKRGKNLSVIISASQILAVIKYDYSVKQKKRNLITTAEAPEPKRELEDMAKGGDGKGCGPIREFRFQAYQNALSDMIMAGVGGRIATPMALEITLLFL
jgi:hypothetical protein